MLEFGLLKALPKLSSSNVSKIEDFLRNDLNIDNASDLALVEETDLTQKGLLKRIQARQLIRYWKTGW